MSSEDVATDDGGKADYSPYLIAASKRGNIQHMLQTLQDHGDEIDVNFQDGIGNSCLHYSAMWGHLDTLQAMLDAGTDVNLRNFQGDTALHKAFYKDNIPMVNMLIQRGADPRAVNAQGLKPGDYARSAEARTLNEKLMNASKQGLVRLAPKPPRRDSKPKVVTDEAPLDMSKLPGMAADEKDVDDD